MESFGRYFLSISAAAIFVALVQKLNFSKGATTGIIKMLCGVFLLFSILRPIVDLPLLDLDDFAQQFQQDADITVSLGQQQAKEELSAIISQQVSAYILDKAQQYNAQLTVTVILSDDTIPVPIQVRIRGNISPYGKSQLQSIIADDLGIAREDQIWT